MIWFANIISILISKDAIRSCNNIETSWKGTHLLTPLKSNWRVYQTRFDVFYLIVYFSSIEIYVVNSENYIQADQNIFKNICSFKRQIQILQNILFHTHFVFMSINPLNAWIMACFFDCLITQIDQMMQGHAKCKNAHQTSINLQTSFARDSLQLL